MSSIHHFYLAAHAQYSPLSAGGAWGVLTTFSWQRMRSTHHFELAAHAVPEWLHPLPAQDPEYHHEGVEEVSEVPPKAKNRIVCY